MLNYYFLICLIKKLKNCIECIIVRYGSFLSFFIDIKKSKGIMFDNDFIVKLNFSNCINCFIERCFFLSFFNFRKKKGVIRFLFFGKMIFLKL